MEENITLLLLSQTQRNLYLLFESFLEDSDSESEDDEMEILYLQAAARTNKDIPMRVRDYLEQVASKYNDVEFKANFRLSRRAFHVALQKLLQVFVGQEPIQIEKGLLAVIWLLATPDSYRSIGSRMNIAKSTLSKEFVRIINGLDSVANFFIKWPTPNEKANTKHFFRARYGEVFENTIGAIDGTYVPIKVPNNLQRVYTNRKKFTGMTLQVVCNEKLEFIDCFTGYPSSVNDIRVLRNSPLYLRIQEGAEQFFVNGEVILGDKAYPNLPWLRSPFIDRGNLTAEQLAFNRQHASCRSVVERSFAHYFGRFRRFRDLDMNRLDWIPGTIMAGCVLHNICISTNDNVEAYIEEGLPIAELVAPLNEPE